MFGIHDLALFMVSGLLLNIMPGPDSLLVMLRSGSQGWRAGSVAALGIGTGVMVHVLAAALGLSALLSASAEWFALIKLAGAIYLIYLGFSLLRQQTTGAMERGATLPVLSYGQIYRQGVLTNVLNPKVALFFLAFVPQFIAPDAPRQGARLYLARLHLQSGRYHLVSPAGLYHRLCQPQGSVVTASWSLAQPGHRHPVCRARDQACSFQPLTGDLGKFKKGADAQGRAENMAPSRSP